MSGGGLFSRSELRVVRAPKSLIPRCGECGLFKGCRSPKMALDGDGERNVLIVGEAPGADEDAAGRPFVGKSGRRLEEALDKLGVNMRRDCWLYNAAVCRPANNDLPPEAVGHCRANLLRVLKERRPNVVILLGGAAVESLIRHCWKDESTDGVSRWTGAQIPAQKINAWICPSWHPSYLLREENAVLDAQFRDHLAAAFDLDGSQPWPNGVPDYRERIEILYEPAEAAARIARYTGGLVAWDYETTTLKPDGPDAKIISCSVCWNGKETIAFPFWGPAKEAIANLLKNGDVGKIASNKKFEDRWTKRMLGGWVRGWAWCTMDMAHALDSRPGITSIKFQSFVRLGQPDYNYHMEDLLKSKDNGGNAPNRIREIGLRDLLLYNGLDSFLEYRVAVHQARELGVPLGMFLQE